MCSVWHNFQAAVILRLYVIVWHLTTTAGCFQTVDHCTTSNVDFSHKSRHEFLRPYWDNTCYSFPLKVKKLNMYSFITKALNWRMESNGYKKTSGIHTLKVRRIPTLHQRGHTAACKRKTAMIVLWPSVTTIPFFFLHFDDRTSTRVIRRSS